LQKLIAYRATTLVEVGKVTVPVRVGSSMYKVEKFLLNQPNPLEEKERFCEETVKLVI
jgi:hypothetical protein